MFRASLTSRWRPRAALVLALTLGMSVASSPAAQALPTPPNFQLPFPCGQQWKLFSRNDHNPNDKKIDMTRDDGTTRGSDVVASADGDVVEWTDPGGIEVRHANGYFSLYLHMRVRSVSPGQHVVQGQKIGEVGDVGAPDSFHLHYELRWTTANNSNNADMTYAIFDGVTYNMGASGQNVYHLTSRNCGSSLAWGASQDVVNASGAGVLDGRPDLIARIGDIGYVYPHLGGSGTSMFAATGIRIGSGWSNITALAVADVATYTGLVVPDGRPDLIARIGDIGYVYPHQGGSGTTLFTPTGLRIGSGWSNITALAAADVADIAGAGAPDGRPDLIARIGDVGYIYPHLGGNGFADTGIRIGSGWTSITGITARDITNATGGGTPDGRPDLIIRIGDIGYVYPHQAGRGTAMFAATGTQIGSGWTSISALTVTDVANTAAAGTPDGRPDLVARIGDIGYVYPHIGGYGTTTFAGTGTRIGSGWTSINLLT
jgi:hypothetical protein